ncbi:hypothetical protein U9003_26255, partial [Escherichia coli]
MGSCAAPSAKGDDKFITTDYLQQCPLPAVRLKNLARYAGMTSVFNIARMSPQKRMAVLVAFVLAWET